MALFDNKDRCILFILWYCALHCQAYTPAGHEGCYQFASNILQTVEYSGDDNNGDNCKDYCDSAGYQYAGTRAMNCWCGNAIGSANTDAVCNWGCPGRSGEVCGGLFAISIYNANYNVNTIVAIVVPIIVVLVIVIAVVIGVIIWRRRKNKREEAYSYNRDYHADRNIGRQPDRNVRNQRSEEPIKRQKVPETNIGYDNYKSPPSHLHADKSLTPDDHSYGKKKRTWSQHDDDDYEDSDSNFTPVAMNDDYDDDHQYSRYPNLNIKHSYHDTAI
ncbi:hypothetical protein ACF0H5_008120 [Mactra antiquata]